MISERLAKFTFNLDGRIEGSVTLPKKHCRTIISQRKRGRKDVCLPEVYLKSGERRGSSSHWDLTGAARGIRLLAVLGLASLPSLSCMTWPGLLPRAVPAALAPRSAMAARKLPPLGSGSFQHLMLPRLENGPQASRLNDGRGRKQLLFSLLWGG